MKLIAIICLIIFFVFIIIIFPFNIKGKLYLNLTELKMYYSIKSLSIKLLMGTTYFEEGKLIHQNPNDLIFIVSDDQDVQIKQNLFIREILKRLNITKIECYADIGIKLRPDISACIVGFIYSLISAVSALIVAKTTYAHVESRINYITDENKFDLIVSCVLEISIFDIIISKIIANNKHRENVIGKR